MKLCQKKKCSRPNLSITLVTTRQEHIEAEDVVPGFGGELDLHKGICYLLRRRWK